MHHFKQKMLLKKLLSLLQRVVKYTSTAIGYETLTRLNWDLSVFSNIPFQNAQSMGFIYAVKMNRMEDVKQYLASNQRLIFDFDVVQ